MEKFYYKLMTPGQKKQLSREGKEVIWNVPYYSKMRKLFAKNDKDARTEIHNTKLNNKWIGFMMFPNYKGE